MIGLRAGQEPSRFLLPIVLFAAAGGLSPAQTISVTPLELTFEVETGGPIPPEQFLALNSDPSGEAFTAFVQTGLISTAWVKLDRTNGFTPSQVGVTVDPGLLGVGTRLADIIVRLGDDGDQRAVRVIAIVSEAGSGGGGGGGGGESDPLIAADPLSLGFSTPSPGIDLATQTLEVQNSGAGVLEYQFNIGYPPQGETGWIDISPTSGTSSGDRIAHQITVATTGLEPGLHSAILLISGNAANSPVEVPVNLTIGGGPILTANPDDFVFAGIEGGANPSGQSLVVGSRGETTFYEISADQSWLSVEPAGGNTIAGPGLHTIQVDAGAFSAGTFLGKLTIDSPTATNAPLTLNVTLNIHPPGSLTTFPSSVSFFGAVGTAVTTERILSLAGASLSGVTWGAAVEPPEATWIKVAPGQGGVPGNLIIAVDNTGLPGGQYNAAVRIDPLGGPAVTAQDAALATIPVQLILREVPPDLSAAPSVLMIAGVEGEAAARTRILQIGNRGGPDLDWTARAQTDSGEEWLKVLPTAGSGPATALVTAEIFGMTAGVHQGHVVLDQGGEETEVPVSLVVSAASGIPRTDRVGLIFDGAEGNGEWTRTARIFALGGASLGWAARIRELTGSAVWLTVSPESGETGPSEILLTARAEGLPAGAYMAVVEISPDAGGPSRFLTVVLRIRRAGVRPVPRIEPEGLVFIAHGDAALTQLVSGSTNRPDSADFQTAASTYDGGRWLSVNPASGGTSAEGEFELSVEVSPSEFGTGAGQGLVSVTFGDGIVRSIPVSVVRPPTGPGPCTPSGLRVHPLAPHQNFNGSSGRPLYLAMVLTDAVCGIAITDEAALMAEFSNGDAAVALDRVSGGVFSATWTPRNAAPQLSVRFTALSGGATGEAVVIGAIESSTAPQLLTFGTVNSAGFRPGRALAPGAIFSSFGSLLADGLLISEAVPLPTALGGATLLADGREAPLYFASGGQINAQLPFETIPGALSQLIARVDGSHSTPQDVVVAAGGPGIFTSLLAAIPPRAVVQNEDLSTNRPSNPAIPGEAVTLYLSGLGRTDPPLYTGEEAPGVEPFARAALEATATIGGKPARILFLGMTPELIGLGQANLIVPEDSPRGDNIPVVISVDGQASNSAVIAVADSR